MASSRILLCVSFYVLLALPCSSLSQVKVGGLCPGDIREKDECLTVMQIATEIINEEEYFRSSFQIELITADTGDDDREALKAACDLVSLNVIGLIGPAYSSEAAVVALEASSLQLPVISYSATYPALQTYHYFSRVVSSDMIVDLLAQFNWARIAIMAIDNSYGRSISSSLIKSTNIIVAQYFDPLEENFTRQLKAIKATNARIIVLVSLPTAHNEIMFDTANQTGLFEIGYQWIATDGLEVSELMHKSSSLLNGILGVRPRPKDATNPINPWYQTLVQKWNQRGYPDQPLSAYTPYLFDALLAFAHALKNKWDALSEQDISAPTNLQCLESTTLTAGPILLETIRHLTFSGASGRVMVDPLAGDSTSQVYDVYNVQNGNVVSVGSWEADPRRDYYIVLSRLQINTSTIVWPYSTALPPLDHDDFAGRKIKIVVALSWPWLMEDTSKTGNERFSGIVVNLWKQLHESYVLARGGSPIDYEIYNLEGSDAFDRRIAEVSNGKADVAIGSLTIKSTRTAVVDMTQPFMDTGLIVITKRVQTQAPQYWDFLIPFSLNLWLAVGSAIFAFAFFFWLDEAIRRYKRDGRGKILPWICSFPYWMLGWTVDTIAMLLGESRKIPTTLSGRIVFAGLKIFAVVLLAGYTASLSANLTSVQFYRPIAGFEDLAGKKVAVDLGGTIEAYVKDSGVPVIKQGITDLNVGLELVLNGTVEAMVHEQAEVQYQLNKKGCELEIAGPLFAEIGYGLVFSKGSSLTSFASDFILKMKESGNMSALIEEGYKTSHEASCGQINSATGNSSLHLYMFFGLMVVAASFLLIGILTKVFSSVIDCSNLIYGERNRETHLKRSGRYELNRKTSLREIVSTLYDLVLQQETPSPKNRRQKKNAFRNNNNNNSNSSTDNNNNNDVVEMVLFQSSSSLYTPVQRNREGPSVSTSYVDNVANQR